jgi:hypothetical protein
LCLLAAFAMVAGNSAFAAPPSLPPAAEDRLLAMTNAARAEAGLTPLQWDDALAQAAAAHAGLVLQNQQLSHQFPGEAGLAQRAAQAGAHFQAIAENVAEGYSVESIQKEWMQSPPHRANILDPKLDAVGFAVVQKNGLFVAVADFAHIAPSLSLEQVEAAVAKSLLPLGIQPSASQLDARQTCEMNRGVAGGSSPRFVVRWQSSDPSRLPASLEDELHAHEYHVAAVGACAAPHAENGFTSYRIAVLLY